MPYIGDRGGISAAPFCQAPRIMIAVDKSHRTLHPTVPADLTRRFDELRSWVGWTPVDELSVVPLRACLMPHVSEFVEDFYSELVRHPAAFHVMTGGEAQIERLKRSLAAWLSDLLSGQYDDSYAIRRWQVGFRHVQIGLDQTFVGVALARLRRRLSQQLERACEADPASFARLSETLHKLLDLDVTLIQAAYDAELQTQRLIASEIRLRNLVDRLPAPAIYVRDGRLAVNTAVEEMTGYSRQDLVSLDQWNSITLSTSPEPPTTGSTRSRRTLRRRDGTDRLVEVIELRSDDDEVWLIQDITDADIARLKAMQAERLALIGQMITTLAHEARNSLQRIRASTETLELELEDRHDLAPVLARLGAAQDDLKTLFDEVRNYAAPVAILRERACLCDLAESAWDSLVEPRKGRQAIFRCERTDAADCTGWFDRFRMEQVFRNLFENSLAACPDPVEIVMRMEMAAIEGRPYVALSIRDNGPGIPDQIRDRVFEPFFTTKAKGTGLGMAIADRIVSAHGGRIELGTGAPGAEFRLLFPRAEHASEPADHRGG